MLKDSLARCDRMSMEAFLSEVDPLFSGKIQIYVEWILDKERQFLMNMEFDSKLGKALKDSNIDLLKELINEVEINSKNLSHVDLDFLYDQLKRIQGRRNHPVPENEEYWNDNENNYDHYSGGNVGRSSDDDEFFYGESTNNFFSNGERGKKTTRRTSTRNTNSNSNNGNANHHGGSRNNSNTKSSVSSNTQTTTSTKKTMNRHPNIPDDVDFDEPISSKQEACKLLGISITAANDTNQIKKAFRKKL